MSLPAWRPRATWFIADGMSKVLGQNIVVENVGGAGGTIETARVATPRNDGYTLLAASMGSNESAPGLYPNPRYASTKEFVPIGLTLHTPAVKISRTQSIGILLSRCLLSR
jgi:tripartite-type tricarboxylate transporter receptor subunit TctC